LEFKSVTGAFAPSVTSVKGKRGLQCSAYTYAAYTYVQLPCVVFSSPSSDTVGKNRTIFRSVFAP